MSGGGPPRREGGRAPPPREGGAPPPREGGRAVFGDLSTNQYNARAPAKQGGRVASSSAHPAPTAGDCGLRDEAPMARSVTAGADAAPGAALPSRPLNAAAPRPASAPSASNQQQQEAAPGQKPHRSDLDAIDYVDDIFCHFQQNERKYRPSPNYMAEKQVEVTADMRAICLDWIIECANRLKMEPPTIFLAGHVLDRFLATKAIRRERMQMVSMVALIIAAKYEEIYPPRIKDYIHISANHFTREDMLRYEHYILHALNYSLTAPTPYNFITRYLFALRETGRPETRDEREVRHATCFVAECALLKLSLHLETLPSLLAAASLHAARQLLRRTPAWPSQVAGVCEYDEAQVAETAATLLAQARELKDGRLKATITRYAEESRCGVSKHL